MSQDTKTLFEKRAREFQKKTCQPDPEEKDGTRKFTMHVETTVDCGSHSQWVQKIEDADNHDDTKAIFKGVKAPSGKGFSESKQPTEKVTQSDTRSSGECPSTRASGDKPKKKNLRTSEVKTSRIDGPEELAEVWSAFLDKKFSPTECERIK